MSDVEEVMFLAGPDLRDEAQMWPMFRKLAPTHMRQIETEFAVDTGRGVVTGKPGDWLAMDDVGRFYTISAEEHRRNYGPAPVDRPWGTPGPWWGTEDPPRNWQGI